MKVYSAETLSLMQGLKEVFRRKERGDGGRGERGGRRVRVLKGEVSQGHGRAAFVPLLISSLFLLVSFFFSRLAETKLTSVCRCEMRSRGRLLAQRKIFIRSVAL